MILRYVPPSGSTHSHSYQAKWKWNLTKPLDLTSNLLPSTKRDRKMYEKASQVYNQQNSDDEKLNMAKNRISSSNNNKHCRNRKVEYAKTNIERDLRCTLIDCNIWILLGS